MRQKNAALQQKILEEAKALAATEGIGSLNIRAVAARCGVAPGTVYNYFESKDEIVLAMAVEFWQQTLHALRQQANTGVLLSDLAAIYAFLLAQMGDFRAGLLGDIRKAGAARIQHGKAQETVMLGRLQEQLCHRIQNDTSIPPGRFNEVFTPQACAAFVLQNLLLALERRAPNIDFLLEVLRRLLYL